MPQTVKPADNSVMYVFIHRDHIELERVHRGDGTACVPTCHQGIRQGEDLVGVHIIPGKDVPRSIKVWALDPVTGIFDLRPLSAVDRTIRRGDDG